MDNYSTNNQLINSNKSSYKTVVICLTRSSLKIGRKIVSILENSELHGFSKRFSSKEVDITFDDTCSHLQEIFLSKTNIIGICAISILFRSLAPVFSIKWKDPAVISVNESSNFIPLLGAHHGGNDIALYLEK